MRNTDDLLMCILLMHVILSLPRKAHNV